MQLQAAILHRIIKTERTSGVNAVVVKPRTTQLPIEERLLRTAEDALRIYGAKINGYGTFDTDHVLYQFPVLLHQYVNDDSGFVNFSQETTNLIAAEMRTSFFANGGYVLFLRYQNQGQDWVLIVMLKLKPGTGINEDTLSLEDTLSFDIDHLHEAARIDLEKWQTNTQPYLSFIKKSKDGEDVTRYFRQALGCTEYIDSKYHTDQAIKAVDAFCKEKNWTTEQLHNARRRTYEYCDEKDKNGENANLTALSAIIFDQEPSAFLDYVRENDYEVSETFKPHKKTYTKLHRINGAVGNIKFSFDVEDIEQQRVDYDSERNCLIINNISQCLIDKIKAVKNT